MYCSDPGPCYPCVICTNGPTESRIILVQCRRRPRRREAIVCRWMVAKNNNGQARGAATKRKTSLGTWPHGTHFRAVYNTRGLKEESSDGVGWKDSLVLVSLRRLSINSFVHFTNIPVYGGPHSSPLYDRPTNHQLSVTQCTTRLRIN